MVDQGRDILKDDPEVLTEVRVLGAEAALEDIGYQALLVHYVLPDIHRILLQLVDVQKELLVYILHLVDPAAEAGHVLGDKLHDVGIKVDTPVHDGEEHRESVRELLRESLDLQLESVDGAERNLPDSGQDAAGHDE